MAKIKTIPCDPYKKNIQVFIGSYEELLKYANKKLKKDVLLDIIKDGSDESYDACFYYRSNGTGIIHIFKYPLTPEEISDAGHEVLHAVFHILSYVGVDYQPSCSNESFTYLFGHIMTQLLTKKGYLKA